MYVKRHYTLWMTLKWSRKPLIYGFLYSVAIIAIYELTNIPFTLPWQPISVIGIAVAFYLGFKNNSSYDRTWEARKIWGAIVNDSRTFATAVLSLVEGPDDLKKELVYRHLAWLVALKNTLRKPRTWEHNEDPAKLKFAPSFCEDFSKGIEPEIRRYLSPEEFRMVNAKSNISSQLLKLQAEKLQEQFQNGSLSDFKHTWMHQLISRHFDNQGKCERIKNFPFPRQYASTCLWINYIFCTLIPFGLLDIFEQSTQLDAWLTIPFSSLIIWIFFLMDKIGDYSENPFEGAYNDVPISSITRAIEIDLLEMLDEKDIPIPYPVENNFLM